MYMFGISFERMVMYRCMSHSTSVSKFWGGGCRELSVLTLWENWFNNHCKRSVVMVALWLPLWSYMLAFDSCMLVVGVST